MAVRPTCLLPALAIARHIPLASLNAPYCGAQYQESSVSAESVVTIFVTKGEDAELGQHPWIASLQYRRPGKTFSPAQHMCGGTLVKDRSGHSLHKLLLSIPHLSIDAWFPLCFVLFCFVLITLGLSAYVLTGL